MVYKEVHISATLIEVQRLRGITRLLFKGCLAAASYQNEVSILDFGMRPGPSLFPRPDCPFRSLPRALAVPFRTALKGWEGFSR